MVAIPFIYFSIFLIYILYKKKRFDVSAYLISIYLISSFFSIIIDIKGLRPFYSINYEISIVPTILYCILLTLAIYPFTKLPTFNLSNIKPIRPSLFNTISYVYIAVFFVLLILSFSILVNILTGDMGQIRLQLARGQHQEFSAFKNINIFLKPLVLISSILSSVSMVMLLFYFYSLCFLHKSKLFNTLLFISSTSILILAILGVDRSKVVYWILSYGFFVLMFWRVMNNKQKKSNLYIALISISLIAIYFITLTVQRFDQSHVGSQNSMIDYAGQSFINFSYFFDNHPYKGFTLQKVFPLLYKLFDNNTMTNGELNQLMTIKTGIPHGIFNTFIGDIMMASNSIISILYCLTIFFISSRFIKKNIYNINFYFMVILFFLYSIVLLGVFTHFYTDFTRTIVLSLFIFYASISNKYKIIL